jgi:hypothetical protein
MWRSCPRFDGCPERWRMSRYSPICTFFSAWPPAVIGAGAVHDHDSASVDGFLYPNDGGVLIFTLPIIIMHRNVESSKFLFGAYEENFAYPAGGYGSTYYSRRNAKRTSEWCQNTNHAQMKMISGGPCI